MRRLALVLYFPACMFLACVFMGGTAQAQLGTFTTHTTTWNNLTRTYSVYLPPALQPSPALVLAMHGTAITTQSDPPLDVCTAGMGWNATADANGFVLVCPIATYIPGSPSGRFLWDSYGLDSYFPAPPDDSGFLRSLILLMQQPTSSGGFATDPNRTFVMGFSSGAMMAHRVCIENSDLVAACGVASGTLWAASQAPTVPPPSQPVSIIELHGDADPTLDYCGDNNFYPVPNEPAVTVPSMDVDVNYWLAADGLGSNSTPLCSDGAVSPTVFRVDSRSASGQVEVQFVREMGYVHTYEAWTISSTWEFFSTHGRSNFAIAANPAGITVASPGQSGSTTLTFTAENGLTGSTTLSPAMCSNLPSETACSFSPAIVTFTSSTTTVPVTLTVSTTASSSSGGWTKLRLPIVSVGGGLLALCLVGLYLLLVRIDVSIGINMRQRLRAVSAGVGLLLMASMLGCGGGGNVAVGGGNPGTPPGNYAGMIVTVTINGVTQSIKNLSVNVQ
jgi:poly(3-hydroxybutyrate) depolymerase